VKYGRTVTLISALGLGCTSLILGCPGDVSEGAGGTGVGAAAGHSGTGGAGTGGTGTGGTATGGSVNSGDCDDSSDCGGEDCIELAPGGFRICASSPPEATECVSQPPMDDECCTTADCAAGACHDFATLPYCGGPQPASYNLCVVDLCSGDGDCPSTPQSPALCAPAHVFGSPVRICMTAFCRTDADCGAGPGGICAPIDSPCCGWPQGLGCVYPDGCRFQQDCPTGSCALDIGTGTGICLDETIPCPP